MPVAGTAFDGSPWVTAASSIGLVVTSLGLAVLGGTVIARKTLDGSLGLPTDMGVPDAVQRRRSIPLEKSGDRSPSDVGTSPESVDFLQSNDVKE